MSEIQVLKEQLHQVAGEAEQAAGGLSGFESSFTQHIQHVESLISGSATGADREIAQVLDAASKSVNEAVGALKVVATKCAGYADSL